MRELQRHLFHLGDFDVLHLMPRIDEAAVDKKVGFSPAFDERFDFAFTSCSCLMGSRSKDSPLTRKARSAR
jgi:hypothetical protein